MPAQVESVYAEVLTAAPPAAQIEALYAQALVAGTPQATISATYAQVLVTLATPKSNVYDHDEVEREVFRWDGAELVPVTWAH